MMKLYNKLPYVRKLIDTIEELKAEIRARDEFSEQLIEEEDRLREDKTELITKLNKARDEFDQYKAEMDVALSGAREGNDMWSKRWQDEHEKYSDLCDQLRGMMIQLKDAAENVLMHTNIDT